MGIINKLFGTRSEREVKKLLPTVDRIEALGIEIAKLSDEEKNSGIQAPLPKRGDAG